MANISDYKYDAVTAVVHSGTGQVMPTHDLRVVRGHAAEAAFSAPNGHTDMEFPDADPLSSVLRKFKNTLENCDFWQAQRRSMEEAMQSIVNDVRADLEAGQSFRIDDWDDFQRVFGALDAYGVDVERPSKQFKATVKVSATFTVSGRTFGELSQIEDVLRSHGDWTHDISFTEFEDADGVDVEQEESYIDFEIDRVSVREITQD